MRALVAIAAGLLTSAALSAQSMPIHYGLTGTWFEPATAGQGVLIEVVPERGQFILSWFTYAGAQDLPAQPEENSEQRWYFAQGSYAEGDTEVLLTVLRPAGGQFAISPAAQLPVVGSAELSFANCEQGLLRYQFNDSVSGEIALQRLVPDTLCASLQPASD